MGAFNFALLVFGIMAVNNVSAFHEICAGCPIKHDPSTFSMDKLSRALATANVNDEATKIISVTTQVVSGVKYTVVYESSSGKTCTATWQEMESPIGVRISCETEKSFDGLDGSSKFVGALLKAHQMQKRPLRFRSQSSHY
uniref:Sarcocystatin-A n=1 Tax=Lygus hesperus TaxID=30085 RepID=A0A0A9XA75_LYGHE